MSDHQIHFGRKFYLDKQKGYWISTGYPRIRAHQWVWINMHGLIPKGYHIHHKNENKSDNRIENLELIERSRHLSHHMQNPERKVKSKEICDKIRPLTKKWHASEEGLAWHKLHGIKTWSERNSFKITCKQCNKEADTKTFHQEFCSNACKSKWRRNNKLDHIEKTCPVCSVKYLVNKYAKTNTCGRSCGHKSIAQLNKDLEKEI